MGDLIDQILDIEQEMFLSVKTKKEPLCLVSCRKNPAAFRGVRRAGFETWDEPTLDSYLSDLREAKEKGRNLMTLKYARMNEDIPCINDNPIIETILMIHSDMSLEFARKHPGIINDSQKGIRYLRSELETYSDRTVSRYHSNLIRAKFQGINLVEEAYRNMFKLIGLEL